MKLTILGNEGPFPTAGGATTSYLLEVGSNKVLMDLGAGTLGRLLQFVDSIDDVDVLILSHLHYDHISDVSVLKYMSEIGGKMGRVQKTLKIYTPNSPKAEFNNLPFEEAFEIHVIDESLELTLESCKITFAEMIHPVQSFAVKVTSEDRVFVYSSDTVYNDKLSRFADHSDFFLCECCHYKDEELASIVHLRSNETGTIARDANVKQLMITHFIPGVSSERLLEEVSDVYHGSVSCSEQMKTYEF